MALPKGYKVPASQGVDRYLKPAKLPKGDTRIRILSDIITGFIWWDETDEGNRPVRVPNWKDVPKAIWKRDSNKAVHFWATAVWNYTEEAVQILEITQRTIQEALTGYEENAEYGDLKAYDITITRKGEGRDTSYVVLPSPTKKPMSKEVVKEYTDLEIDLQALYAGEDPFGGGVSTPADEVDINDVIDDLDGAAE
jgi:hypothetical protein